MFTWTFNHLTGFFPRLLDAGARRQTPKAHRGRARRTRFRIGACSRIRISPHAGRKRLEACFRNFRAGSEAAATRCISAKSTSICHRRATLRISSNAFA